MSVSVARRRSVARESDLNGRELPAWTSLSPTTWHCLRTIVFVKRMSATTLTALVPTIRSMSRNKASTSLCSASAGSSVTPRHRRHHLLLRHHLHHHHRLRRLLQR